MWAVIKKFSIATCQTFVCVDDSHLNDYKTVKWKETGDRHFNIPSIWVETALSKAKQNYRKIDTWNVWNSLRRCGKLENLKLEMREN